MNCRGCVAAVQRGVRAAHGPGPAVTRHLSRQGHPPSESQPIPVKPPSESSQCDRHAPLESHRIPCRTHPIRGTSHLVRLGPRIRIPSRSRPRIRVAHARALSQPCSGDDASESRRTNDSARASESRGACRGAPRVASRRSRATNSALPCAAERLGSVASESRDSDLWARRKSFPRRRQAMAWSGVVANRHEGMAWPAATSVCLRLRLPTAAAAGKGPGVAWAAARAVRVQALIGSRLGLGARA
jgi:hypothetical protein